nr:copia protein [Tanacetum cinerariifolium]
MAILEITFDSEFVCETQEPLPPLPKLIGVEPADISNSLMYLVDLTLNMDDLTLNTSVPKKTKQTFDKVSPTCAIKKKSKTNPSAILLPPSEKKADSSAEQLFLTLMEEVKSLKEHIRVPSDNTSSVLQNETSKSSKGKQTTKMKNLNEVMVKKLRSDNGAEFKNYKLEEFYDEKVDDLEPTKIQDNVINEPISEVQSSLTTITPSKLTEAMEEEGWIIAMQEELNQFKRNKVWNLVPKPHGKTIIGTKWICKNKMEKHGIVIENKAKLVAQGYNQQEGIDYEETFAPVVQGIENKAKTVIFG